MRLKIFNPDLVDCSSSVNMMSPNAESRELLLNIFLKLCASDTISIIISHSLELDFHDSSGIYDNNIDVEFKSPQAFGFSEGEDCRDIYNFKPQTGIQAKDNKTAGLFIESNIEAYQNLLGYRAIPKYSSNSSDWEVHLLPAGLKGINKGVSLVKLLYARNYNALPIFLRYKNLVHFNINANIMWKTWTSFYEDPKYGKMIDYNHHTVDFISANSRDLTLSLGGICVGGQQGRPDGDKHYVGIQKFLDKYWPNQYTIREYGESPSNNDGRKALEKYANKNY